MKYEIEKISVAVARELGMELEALKTTSKKQELKEARHWCMFFCCTEKAGSLREIGLFFGGRHYSTVIHARDTIQDYIQVEKKSQRIFERLKICIDSALNNRDIDPYSHSMLTLAGVNFEGLI